jgi:hypothetical protein
VILPLVDVALIVAIFLPFGISTTPGEAQSHCDLDNYICN